MEGAVVEMQIGEEAQEVGDRLPVKDVLLLVALGSDGPQ
jgi:hypothetical protein